VSGQHSRSLQLGESKKSRTALGISNLLVFGCLKGIKYNPRALDFVTAIKDMRETPCT